MNRPPASQTIPALLDAQAAAFADREAVVAGAERISYRSLRVQVRTAAKAFWALGVRRGSHVAILMDNRPAWIVAFLALQQIGATAVGLNTWSTPREMEYALVHAEVDTLEQFAPNVSLRVVPLTTRDPRRLLEEEAVDLAIGHFPSVLADLVVRAQSGDGVAFAHTRLYDGEYVCVMRTGHALASGPLTLNRFCAARHMLVSFSGRPFGFIDESLAAMGRKRQIVLTVNQFFTAGRVVAKSNLLTVLPRHFVGVTGIADQLVQRQLPFDVAPVNVDAVWHRRVDAQSAHAWLRQEIVQSAARAFQPA